MARQAFSERDCIKVLLWCRRHCCLCENFSGVGIEVAHLPGKEGSSDIDDAMPLCFDCHAKIGHYNPKHARGKKYRIDELKATRNQVYDKYTSHLVPSVHYELTQHLPGGGSRQLPDIGFDIHNRGDRYHVQAQVKIILAQGVTRYVIDSGHYNGNHRWNLNPGQMYGSHFLVSPEILQVKERLRARIDVTLVDIYERPHELLPVGFIHELGNADSWYAEPSMEELGVEPAPKI